MAILILKRFCSISKEYIQKKCMLQKQSLIYIFLFTPILSHLIQTHGISGKKLWYKIKSGQRKAIIQFYHTASSLSLLFHLCRNPSCQYVKSLTRRIKILPVLFSLYFLFDYLALNCRQLLQSITFNYLFYGKFCQQNHTALFRP